jgi:hypothetical protein
MDEEYRYSTLRNLWPSCVKKHKQLATFDVIFYIEALSEIMIEAVRC